MILSTQACEYEAGRKIKNVITRHLHIKTSEILMHLVVYVNVGSA
jgi:hypothetical protein